MNRTLTFLIATLIIILAILTIRSAINKGDLTPEVANAQVSDPNAKKSFENWKKFTWEKGHFGIMLPSFPQHVSDKSLDQRTKEMLVYDTFVADDNQGQGYLINTITFPRKIDSVDVVTTLTNVVKDIIARTDENKLNSIKESKFKDYKALDFSYANGNRTIHGKVFAVDDTVYMLGVVDTSPQSDNEVEFFMNSFEILTPHTKK